MYLHTRTATIRNDVDPLEAGSWALEAAALAREASGLEVQLWRAVYGRPLGSYTWSIAVDSMGTMAAGSQQALADPAYLAWLERGRGLFLDGTEDHVAQILYSGVSGAPEAVVATVTAQCANGHIADAITWGLELSESYHSITGLDVHFVRSLFGPWATIGWLSVAPSIAAYEEGSAALQADPNWLPLLDSGGAFFTPGSGTSWMSALVQ
jgi:hypothetical protein